MGDLFALLGGFIGDVIDLLDQAHDCFHEGLGRLYRTGILSVVS